MSNIVNIVFSAVILGLLVSWTIGRERGKEAPRIAENRLKQALQIETTDIIAVLELGEGPEINSKIFHPDSLYLEWGRGGNHLVVRFWPDSSEVRFGPVTRLTILERRPR